MIGANLRQRVKSFFKWWTTPIRRPGPTEKLPDKPRRAIAFSIGILFLLFLYFSILVPYEAIPAKDVFWVAFAAWALPPIIVTWAYRNAPTRRANNANANLFIGIGVAGITIYALSDTGSILELLLWAVMPGAMSGGLIGADTVLLWKSYKGQLIK